MHGSDTGFPGNAKQSRSVARWLPGDADGFADGIHRTTIDCGFAVRRHALGHPAPTFGARCQPRATTYFIKARIDSRQRWFTLGRHGPLTPAEARSKADKCSPRLTADAIQRTIDRLSRKRSSVTGRQKQYDPLDKPIVRPSPLSVFLVAESYGHSPAAQAAIYRVARASVTQQRDAKLTLLAERHGS